MQSRGGEKKGGKEKQRESWSLEANPGLSQNPLNRSFHVGFII